MAGSLGTDVIVNEKPIISDKDAIAIAVTSGDEPKGLARIKEVYTGAVEKVLKMGMDFADHPDIKSIVLDTGSQFFEWILFSHFGRRNQIAPTSRGAPNQDMIDFVNAMRSKNLVVVHRAKEIWRATGAMDKSGSPIKEPSGKFESDGFRNIGGFLTANLELTNRRIITDDYSVKFRAKMVTCQCNVLLEGQDLHEYGISGEGITWDNLMAVLGMVEE